MSDLKPSTRELLELGRLGDDPSDAAVGQNRRALAKRLGVAALGASAVAGSTSKAAAAAFTGTWTTTKVAVLCGVVAIGAAATWKIAQPSQPTHSVAAPVAVPAPPAPSVKVAAPPDQAGAPVELPAASESSMAAPHAAPSSRVPATRSIKDELELVRAAQQALNRGEPQAALALLAQHAQRFPSGVLSEDREASRVFALCRLGNVAAARAAADAFVRRAPKSPFVDRVRAACREPAPTSSR